MACTIGSPGAVGPHSLKPRATPESLKVPATGCVRRWLRACDCIVVGATIAARSSNGPDPRALLLRHWRLSACTPIIWLPKLFGNDSVNQRHGAVPPDALGGIGAGVGAGVTGAEIAGGTGVPGAFFNRSTS